jgi:hypothetical protein
MAIIKTKKSTKCFMCGRGLSFAERLNCRTVGHNCCAGCKAEAKNDLKCINDLIISGHTRHCAYRMVWGDGECECKHCTFIARVLII